MTDPGLGSSRCSSGGGAVFSWEGHGGAGMAAVSSGAAGPWFGPTSLVRDSAMGT